MRWTQLLRCSSKLPKDYSNFPESYIKKEMETVEWRTPKEPQYLQKVIKNKDYYYTLHRPWTEQAKRANAQSAKKHKIWVEPVKEWSFFRGDRVEILIGKDKGKQGIINTVVQERNWVVVEGLNCYYQYMGNRKDFPGVMTKTEAPLRVTDQVALVDPSDNKPTAVQWRFTEQGEKVRVSERTGRILPIPPVSEETYDYKTKATYPEQPKDTKSKELQEITFSPALKTFEMDIMDQLNITEDRKPIKFFWY